MIDDILAEKERVENLLKTRKKVDWRKEFDFFNLMLTQLQKERHLHLLVTLTTGMATLISAMVTILSHNFSILALDFILGGLFVAYLIHYRFLENTTQSWYKTLAEIKTRI